MEKEFIAYEYKTVYVSKDRSQLFFDLIDNFGWEVTKKENCFSKVKVDLRRKYSQQTYGQIVEQEKTFFDSFDKLEKIKSTKKDSGTLISLTIGLIGTSFMAGAVFSFLASKIILMVSLAIPAFVLWAIAPLIYKKLVNKSQAKANIESAILQEIIYRMSKSAFDTINK